MDGPNNLFLMLAASIVIFSSFNYVVCSAILQLKWASLFDCVGPFFLALCMWLAGLACCISMPGTWWHAALANTSHAHLA